MKLGVIVYSDELQIMFEFRHYWSIFDSLFQDGNPSELLILVLDGFSILGKGWVIHPML
jgi:hypothetical protein